MDADYGAEYDFQNDLDYQTELVKLAIAGALADRMEVLGLSRMELAERLHVSPARVTQMLAGYENVTIKTLVNVAMALDTHISLELVEAPPTDASEPLQIHKKLGASTARRTVRKRVRDKLG